MVSLVIAINSNHQTRDALLQDIEGQNFPNHALQVVLVSGKLDNFQNLPELNFDIRTVLVTERRHRQNMMDIAIRQTSGDFIYVMDEESIFDNANDLLRLYEFMLENPAVDVCLGYNVEHKMYESKSSSPRIIKSEVMSMTGDSNVCFRRKVIDSGFLYSRYLFAENAYEEFQQMGYSVDKLKWLQVHHQKNISLFWVGVFRIGEMAVHSAKKISKISLVQKIRMGWKHVFASEKFQEFSKGLRWKLQGLRMFLVKYSRLAWQLGRIYFIRFKVFSYHGSKRFWLTTKHQYRLLLHKSQKRVHQLKLGVKPIEKPIEKIFVPHLESNDSHPEQISKMSPSPHSTKPLFKLKTPKEPGPSSQL